MLRSSLRFGRRAAVVAAAAAIASALAAAPAGAERPAGDRFCPAATAEVLIDHQAPGLDWAENLTIDDAGALWVTRALGGMAQRYDDTGRADAAVPVPMPGAIRQGPDGLMYVLADDNPLGMIPGVDPGAILRFDPRADQPVPEVFTTGLGMPNGLDFDDEGNAYVADTSGQVVRVRPDGSIDADWTARAPQSFQLDRGVNVGGFNGLAVSGDAVYVTLMQSVSGRVLRIPIDAPEDSAVAGDITEMGLPLITDDLVAADDDTLYVTTSTGRLVHLDPQTGRTCTVLADQPLTSAAFLPGSATELVVGTLLGDVLTVHLDR